MAFTSSEKIIMELAIASYGRVLAQSGLDHYASLLEDGIQSEDEIRDEMMSNSEASMRYPEGLGYSDIVLKVFDNVLGRTPAQSGIDFYTARLGDGLSTSMLIGEILSDARTNNGADKAQLDNKLSISEYYLSKVASSQETSIESPDLSQIDATDESLKSLKTTIDNSLIGNSTSTNISSVEIAEGSYSCGGIVDIIVNFNQDVDITGTDSTLEITVGEVTKKATYAYSDSTSITYKYVIEDGYASSDATLGVAGNSLTLNNTIIRDSINLNVPLVFEAVTNEFASVTDVTAPEYALYSAQYDSKTNNFDLYGSGFSTLLEYDEGATTDIKEKIDFTKLIWDIDGDDDETTVSIVSFSQSDVVIAKVIDDNQLKIVFNSDIILEDAVNYGHNNGVSIDAIDIASGFLIDTAGNISTAPLMNNLILGIDNIVYGNTNDNIISSSGNVDILSGGSGNDRFVFIANTSVPVFSNTVGIDKITDLNVNGSLKDTIDLDVIVDNVYPAVNGKVNQGSFVDDMNTLLQVPSSGFNTITIGDISASLVHVTSGDMSGTIYLVADYNADNAFTVDDFIIDVTGITNTSLTIDTFV